MALNSGKILMRRGQEVNFDANKMTPGEWAVSLDSKYVRMCFSPGVCVRMATYDAFEADMVQIQRILAECQTVEEAVQRIYEEIKNIAVDVERIETASANALKSEQNALNSANSASQSANIAVNKARESSESANIASTKAGQATEQAEISEQKAHESSINSDNALNMSMKSQSYAIGATGTRDGEDTDNAKYYSEQSLYDANRAEEAAERAERIVGFSGSYSGLSDKPQINGIELEGNKNIDELGGLTSDSVVSFVQAEERSNIEATDSVKSIFGKIKKWFSEIKPHAFNNPINNLLSTIEGNALDSTQGKVLSEKIDEVERRMDIIRGTLNQGNTQISLHDNRITHDSVLSFYTSVYGVSPETVNVGDGVVKLTFKEMSVSLEVGVRIDG